MSTLRDPRRLASVVLTLLVAASAASAEEESPPAGAGGDPSPAAKPPSAVERYGGLVSGDDPRWIPGLFVGFDVSVQTAKGTNINDVRGPLSGDETFAAPVVDFGGQLFGPPLDFLPGSPRPFMHGAYQFWPTSEQRIAREGQPQARATPPNEILPGTESDQFRGQGTEIDWDVGGSWYTGLGLSWLLPIAAFDRNIQIRPSLDYFGETGDARSFLTNVEGPTGGPFTETNLAGSAPLTLHGLGPRIQLESYIARRGPIGLSVYAGAQFYWFLGDRQVQFTAGDGTSSMDVTLHKQPLVAQGGVGFRVHWLGTAAE